MHGDTRPALVADFHRYYGLSLASMREWGIPLHEVAAMAMHLPTDSAVRRVLDPYWQRTNEIDLLREIEWDLRVIQWQNGSKRGTPLPERLPLPWDPAPAGTMQGDRMTQDEADDFLGWTPEMKEAGTSGR